MSKEDVFSTAAGFFFGAFGGITAIVLCVGGVFFIPMHVPS
jgi:hypothetical protein